MENKSEEARLDALRQLNLLDTEPSEAFDRITRMAAQIFGLPIAAVSLTDLDRQWFKSRVGITHNSIPRDKAPCAQVAECAHMVVIPDLLEDSRYRDSHLARTGVRFYAGAPLTTRDGFGLGAMCVLGTEPRQASATELASLTDLAAMAMAQIELQHAFGRVDPLSGLPNRIQFAEDLEDLARDRPRHEQRIAVLVDLASPEQLSNSVRVMGSSFTDAMVSEAARTLTSAIGPTRKVYHIAATQFAYLAPPGAEEQAYIALLNQKLDELRSSAHSRFVTTTTVGLVPFVLSEIKPVDVLRRAHSAAQDARSSGNNVSVYSLSQDAVHQRRFRLLNDFGTALEAANQLRLVFQPRVDLASRACVGAEALLRWKHPTFGEISPAEFMPIVEQTSLVRATTAWVLDAALMQLAAWRNAGLDLQISVNVSAVNLLEPDFVERAISGLAHHSLAANCLELEVTESALMEDASRSIATLEAIARAGIRLAIDDFGTGYSSLSYLQRIPAHVVKIDQSFLRDIVTDERKRALVATMIELSHKLGYRMVAEGIETLQALALIEKTTCDEAQGYLFGRPMDASDFVAWCQESPYAPRARRPATDFL
ncbi:putative bifunctional diguanylate cyclase/phosphodiesterase [Roseomonas chloroacetimidivorans]|uniref:putative bifunctional diguanylate cyclase/phosphodiesterase n=1 Tax=Roseomonas chloroacetimidivorans TaxID=1766656 RepID=UPI003C77CD7C